jgi:fructose-1,6-bisphosphatase/inositol monophosphatase family enzyme
MPLMTNQKMEILQLMRRSAQDLIMPRFRNLGTGDVETKAHASDLVTIADREVEERLTFELEAKFPGSCVIGEEAVAANRDLLKKIPNEDLLFVVDPIDGTWNFSNSVPLFGMILSVVERGEVTFGIHYDPVTDYAVLASKGEGAWSIDAQGKPSSIHVSAPKSEREMSGFLPYYAFRYIAREEGAQRLIDTFLKFDRTTSFRCSAHEYKLLAEGSFDFSLTSNVQPWDHLAGLLIHSEAGGHNGLVDGRPYTTDVTEGSLLMAPNKEVWDSLRKHFSFLMD